MNVLGIGSRAIAIYVVLLALVRLSGKRTLREGTAFEFIVALIVGDLVDDAGWGEVDFAEFAVATLVIFGLHLVVSIASARSEFVLGWVSGTPATVLRAGHLLRPALQAERFADADVRASMRIEGVSDLREVDRGTLETNGIVSILLRPWAREAQRADTPFLRRKRVSKVEGIHAPKRRADPD